MKIVVTGHKGFIGNRVAGYLRQNNNELTCISRGDDIPTGAYDLVIHCAGTSPRQDKMMMAQQYIDDNIVYTEEIATRINTARFIFLSTTAVYGEQHADVITEDLPVINPGSYGMSKYIAERFMQEVVPNVLVLRMPVIFGGNDKRYFISRLIDDIRNKDRISVYNLQSGYNALFYIEDLCAIISKIADMEWNGQHIFNLACDSPVKLQEIIGMICDYFGVCPGIEELQSEITCNLISNKRIKYFLGGGCMPTVRDSIHTCLEHYTLENNMMKAVG